MADVLIVDDHELLATVLCHALRSRGIGAETVTPGPLPELLDTLLGQHPELVLLDLELGQYGDATAVVAPLCDAGIRVVVVTGIEDTVRIAAALDQGAVGYRSKTDGLEALVDTVTRARIATGPLDASTHVRLVGELRRAQRQQARARAPFDRLTEREQETLRELATGRSVREIADHWVVSEATVRTHVRSLLGKLGARSQLAAVAMGIRAGWLDVTSCAP